MGRKIKIVTFIQMRNKHFCFFLPLVFMFDVVSSFFFLFWCGVLFSFTLPASHSGWKYLKHFGWYVLLLFLTGTGAENMTYGPLTLWFTVTKAGNGDCEFIRTAFSLQGLPEPDTTDGALKHESSNRLLSFALVLIISKSPHSNFLEN